ncbi:uncharacterized protein [Amphiura filiformis]|uniref:uncharacterized protein isoform X2 n=1 Tax=Amphiura filiformis TaxID=82378 RepID=UPI003B20C04C
MAETLAANGSRVVPPDDRATAMAEATAAKGSRVVPPDDRATAIVEASAANGSRVVPPDDRATAMAEATAANDSRVVPPDDRATAMGEASEANGSRVVPPDNRATATQINDEYDDNETPKVTHSVKEKPSNNVYISHPTEGAAKMVPMGLHIQPVTFKKGSGQMACMVEPGKLAEQAHLEESDVIIAIDSRDVQNVTLEEALDIIGTIPSTFSMTISRRMQTIAGNDIPILVKQTITVEVHMNEDNAVAIKILEIRCERLTYVEENTRTNIRIAHHEHRPGQTPEHMWTYMRVTDDGMLIMHPQDTDECHFKLNSYIPSCQPVGGGYYAYPYTVHNMTSDKVLEIKIDDETHRVALGTFLLSRVENLRYVKMHTLQDAT